MQFIQDILELAGPGLTSLLDERKQLEHEAELTWREVTRKRLNKAGFKRIGRGESAVVYYRRGDPYILKAYRNDDLSTKWYRFIKKNQQNEWLPKLYGKPVRIGETIFLRIEKLKPIPATSIQNYLPFLKALELVAKTENPTPKNTRGLKINVVHDHVAEVESEEDLYDIAMFLSEHKKYIDLHLNNVMDRDGQLVITDPLSPKSGWKN